MPDPMNLLMSWLIEHEPDCPGEILHAAWVHAQRTRNVPAMAEIAASLHAPADLDALIGACPIAAVRVAQLTRAGFPAERGAELLAGERRVSVLAGLTGPDAPRWMIQHVIAEFLARPCAELARALLGVTDLDAVAVDAICRALLPQLLKPEGSRSTELFRRVPHITDLALRDQYVPALLACSYSNFEAAMALRALIAGPLSEPVVEELGQTLLTEALKAMATLAGTLPTGEVHIRAALLRVLLSREDLPQTLGLMIWRVASHGAASAHQLGFMSTTVRIGAAEDLRTCADAPMLAYLAGQRHEHPELVDLLHNPNLTGAQQRALLDQVQMASGPLRELHGVPEAMKLLILADFPNNTVRANGWAWFAEPVAAQRAFLRANASFFAKQGLPASQATSRMLYAVGLVHAAYPLDDQVWDELTVVAVLHTIRDGQVTFPLTRAFSALLRDSLGSDAMAWQTFASLLEGFDGTLAELLEVSKLVTAPPA